MRFLPRRLADLFRVEVVWIDKGQGRWKKQRRFHPLTRIVVIVALLTFGISAGVNFFDSDKTPPAPPVKPTPAKTVATLPEPKIREPRLIDFMPVSADGVVSPEPLPEPIPADLDIDGDEYWLRISKGLYRLYLYRGTEVDRIYKIAVARNPGNKQRRGDNRTPVGLFAVQSVEDSRGWTHDFRDGNGVIRGAYGPWFIRLRTGWQGIGIHGTHAPDSIGTMVSEGCIRMQNKELEDLKQFAFRNMKVLIEE